jgi:FkbM family methyltransferase
MSIIKEIISEEISLISSNLNHELTEDNNSFQLKINNKLIKIQKFKKDKFEANICSWIRDKNSRGKLHEHNTVATLIYLSSIFKNKVIFYDIGAYAGFFSLIAKKFFLDCKLILIEGNPYNFKYLSKIFNSKNDKTYNIVLGEKKKNSNYIIKGHKIYEKEVSYFNRISIKTKNLLKKFLRLFGYKNKNVYIVENLKKEILPAIFQKKDENTTEIFKIDTEGSQAKFIPPYINELCNRKPIIMLEMDNKKQMDQYYFTNDEILNLFLNKNYHAYYLDKKNIHCKIEKITPQYNLPEKNFMCLLIPDVLFNKLNRV